RSGQRTEVDVRAAGMAGGRHRLAGISSSLHSQRCPLSNGCGVLGVFHLGEQGVRSQGLHPRSQIRDMFGAEDEVHMSCRMDERVRIEQSFLHQMCPPLATEEEL